jgi:MraZ protein
VEKTVESVERFFIGEFNHQLDNKNRVIIPSKLRNDLESSIIITCGLENCLVVYPLLSWKNYINDLKNLHFTKKGNRMFIRFLMAKATDITIDKLGRIQLPQNLIEYANIKKEIVINGALDKIEIWSKENWDHYQKEANEKFIEKAEVIFGYDI